METEINELLTRGVAEAIDHDHLKQSLLSKTKLRVKLGIDPTSPNIHIGRAVLLWKLRAFQEFGHKVVGYYWRFYRYYRRLLQTRIQSDRCLT
jgi:tyrosyl-tRNA synthetase